VSSLFLAANPLLFAGNLNLKPGSCAVYGRLVGLNRPYLLVSGFFVKKVLSWYSFRPLKIPAASCRESSTVRKFAIFRYARFRGSKNGHNRAYGKSDPEARQWSLLKGQPAAKKSGPGEENASH
jgi:hypothetical protein